jgi:molybdopterin-biosynthesis enzyme MoeA-like protein
MAKAFGLSMELNQETWELVQQLKQRQQSAAVQTPSSLDGYKRMATFPSPSQQIRAHAKLPIPVVVVNNNVYILPGIPRLFQALLHSLSDHLKRAITSVQPFYRRQISTYRSETLIAHNLTELQHKVQSDGIKIGSYPASNEKNGAKVIVSIVGKNLGKVDQVAKLLVDQIDGILLQAKL